jgi:hypothetical protein
MPLAVEAWPHAPHPRARGRARRRKEGRDALSSARTRETPYAPPPWPLFSLPPAHHPLGLDGKTSGRMHWRGRLDRRGRASPLARRPFWPRASAPLNGSPPLHKTLRSLVGAVAGPRPPFTTRLLSDKHSAHPPGWAGWGWRGASGPRSREGVFFAWRRSFFSSSPLIPHPLPHHPQTEQADASLTQRVSDLEAAVLRLQTSK